MKTIEEIHQLKKYGDIIAIAKETGYSVRQVRAVLSYERKDKKGVVKAFSNLIERREKE